MTVSAYQIDNVIRAYSKQSKSRLRADAAREDSAKERYTDVVTISGNENAKLEAYRKISYSLMDVLLKKGDHGPSR